jgi:hypothetical protein
MRHRTSLWAVAAVVAAVVAVTLTAVALGAAPPVIGGGATPKTSKECKGITVCDSHEGPWVIVPGSGEVVFLEECADRNDIVAGIYVPTSAPDIRVTWDGFPGVPVYSKRAPKNQTTYGFIVFHGVSVDGQPGAFSPRLGCIPRKGGGHNRHSTLSARVSSAAAPKTIPLVPLDAWVTDVNVTLGTTQKGTAACSTKMVDQTKKTEHMIRGLAWTSVALDVGATPPAKSKISAALADVHATVTEQEDSVVATITSKTGGGLTSYEKPLAQVGVKCAL